MLEAKVKEERDGEAQAVEGIGASGPPALSCSVPWEEDQLFLCASFFPQTLLQMDTL